LALPELALLALAGVSFEFIYEEAPFPSCHASTLIECPAPGSPGSATEGEILAAWFGGTDEGERDVKIWGARRGREGWSKPALLASDPMYPCWNPVLFREERKDGPARVWLFYKAGRDPQSWSGFFKSSDDEGRTFGAAEILPAGILGPVKNKPLLTPDGEILCGTSVESHGAWASWVDVLDSTRKTWRKHGPISVPGKPLGIIQPAVVPGDAPGAYRMFTRSSEAIGRICIADSRDGGKTWTDARPGSLVNPDSGIDAVRLADGRIVLLHNDSARARTPLSISVSKDLGETWKKAADLETERGEYSYPAVIELRAGGVACTYTWQRKRIRFARIPAEALGER